MKYKGAKLANRLLGNLLMTFTVLVTANAVNTKKCAHCR